MALNQDGDRRPCRGCGRPIGFFRDADGKQHALDMRAEVFMLVGDMIGKQVAVKVDAFALHSNVCPKRDELTKGKKP